MIWHHLDELPRGTSARVIQPIADMTPVLRLGCGKVWEDVVSHALGVGSEHEHARWEWDDVFDELIPRILMGTEVLTYDSGETALRYNTPEQVHRFHSCMTAAFNETFVADFKLEYIEQLVENVRAFYEIANRNGEATLHAWV